VNVQTKIRHETLVNVTSKSQVLIPKAIRDEAGIVPNRPVRVGINDRGETVILPADAPKVETQDQRRARIEAALKALTGKFSTGQGTDEIMREIRGDWEP
jgi:antitoxin PrlF